MKKVILEKNIDEIRLTDIPAGTAILAKNNEIIRGMLCQEDNGWILRFASGGGATGWHKTRLDCIRSCLDFNYEFFTE